MSALALTTASQFSYAAHPLITDDTGTQGKGNSQLEANTDWLRHEGSQSRIASVTYTYGANSNLDLFLNLPLSLSSPKGMNDISVGSKWKIWENRPSSIGIKPELFLPSGDVDRGLGYGQSGIALTLLLSHEAEPWTFHANVGFQVNRYSQPALDAANRHAVWRASIATLHNIGENTALVVDVGIAKNIERASGRNPAFALIGLIYSPKPNLDVDFGVKAGLNSAEVHKQIGCGLTVRF